MHVLTVLLLSTVSAFLQNSNEFISFNNVEAREIPGKGLGLVSLADIEQNEILVKLDKQVIYYLNRDFPLRKNIEKVLTNYSVIRNKIGLYFLDTLAIVFYTYPDREYIEQQINTLKLDKKAYFPLSSIQVQYFESLPKDCSNYFTFSTKTQDLLKMLFGEVEMSGFVPIFDEVMQIFRNRLKNLPKKKREFLLKVLDDEEKLKTAICWISSRSFMAPKELVEDPSLPLIEGERRIGGEGMMVPIVDLVNCCFDAKSGMKQSFKLEVEDESLTFKISKAFKQGEELCCTYSTNKNLKYFLNYGFFEGINNYNSFERVINYINTEKNKELIDKFGLLRTEDRVHLNFEINNYQEIMTLYAVLTGKLAFELMIDVISHSNSELEEMNVLVYSLQETLNYLKKHTQEKSLVEERLNAVRVKLSQYRVHLYFLVNAADDLLGKLDAEIQSML